MGTQQRLRTIASFAVLTFLGLTFAQDDSSQSRPLNDGSFKFGTRTSFSCTGRAAGYYADVETGCQIYHMCDGLGRQFSYACPNTTLFQQRMLICDHWYMVNCSKAESNYAANLLIGQRDKPFVPEEENEIRTPRPDLLDRPDALDFGAPSLKNFFKSSTPARQNAIFDTQSRSRSSSSSIVGKGQSEKRTTTSPNAEIFQESASNHGLPIHWSGRFADENATPTNETQPAAREQPGQTKTKRDEDKNESRKTITITTSERPTVTVKTPSRRYEPPFTPTEYQQRGVVQQPVPTADSNLNTIPTTVARGSSFVPNVPTTTTVRPRIPSTQRSTINVSTTGKPPVTTASVRTTNQTPPSTQQLPRSQPAQFQPLAANPPVSDLSDPRQSILPPKAILFSPPAATAGLFENRFANQRPQVVPAGVSAPSRELLPPYENLANFDQIKTRYTSESIYTRQPITNEPSAGPVKTAIDKLAVADPLPAARPTPTNQDKIPRPFSVPKPANDLVPPRKEYVFYDDATTQGPPIYYQWKWSVPSFGLDPPGLEAPAAPGAPSVEGSTLDGLLPPVSNRKVDNDAADDRLNAQLNPASQEHLAHDGGQSREHNQTARSISSETGNLGENRVEVENKLVVPLPQHNYLQLRQQFAIPDFTFPLDGAAKGGQYANVEAVDSFQVKIPSDASSRGSAPPGVSARAWYGENARCPECHPGFLRPGSCEPCVKIRR
ncbi:AGAP003751-PA [Anopheles gambiae str. PEST]|uniref:AGAP003751-PA n=1 Tax=Anopheles gambiae TaxID=7165 RepID=Q7QG03_ANOGA|nr:AGAP003751-PA [Anopheles gambiae str. PEST]